MAASGFDGGWLSAHLGDASVSSLFMDEAELAAMARVEAALAAVQGRLGIIPAEIGARLSESLKNASVSALRIRDGAAQSGIPVPALVASLREQVAAADAPFVHFGATTQDIMDTGLILRLSELLNAFSERLDVLILALADQAERTGGAIMAARTWGQAATPTTLGLRISAWLAPLIRSRDRLRELMPRLLVLQWGGASGTAASMGAAAEEIESALAQELGIARAVKPWQTERDNLAELAGWLSLLTGTLGKMGADLKLMASSGEAFAGVPGSSSTMPQKANPVGAEALLTLSRFNAAQIGGVHAALVHAEERDAGPWQSEWLFLPQMAIAAGAALRHAQTLATSIRHDPEAMAEIIARGRGTLLAEAAQFALAAHIPRPEATTLVKEAISAMGPNGNLFDVLRALTDAPVDWDHVANPGNYIGSAHAFVERTVAAARQKS
ncbi:MAG: lyase family protein [Pseudomonadota bacterium]